MEIGNGSERAERYTDYTTEKKKLFLKVWRFLWLFVSVILELPLSVVCLGGVIMFRKWTDKMMILAFCLMFLGWIAISIASMVRAKRGCKWVILPQLWMKMTCFTAGMTIFYLFAPILPATLAMAALTVVMVIASIYINKEMTGISDHSLLHGTVPGPAPDFLYLSEGKSEWTSAYFLWMAEREYFTREYLDRRIGEDLMKKIKVHRTPPRKLFEAVGGCAGGKDVSETALGFTLAFFIVGSAEYLRLFPILGGYEEVLEEVLEKHEMNEESEFDPAVYRELAEELDRAFQDYQILQERVYAVDQKSGKALTPARVMQRGMGEIRVYSHDQVSDPYLKACLEDYGSLNAEIRERVESFRNVCILIYPPHGEDRVFALFGTKEKDPSSEGVALFVRNGALFRSGEASDVIFRYSPWVMIRNEQGAERRENN